MATIRQCKGEGCTYPPFHEGWCMICERTRYTKDGLEIIEWDAPFI